MAVTRVLFTTDLHGSDVCFRKFLSAAKIHKADVLIVGGDTTGKAIVPITQEEDGTYKASFFDSDYNARTPKELEDLEAKISGVGFYSLRLTKEEFEELSKDDAKLDSIFVELMRERIRKWIKLAEEHFGDGKHKFLFLPGNDDRFEIDVVLEESDFAVNPEGKVLYIDDHHEIISTGFSNITPWNCPRDIPEDKLAEKIEAMASQLKDVRNSIFCFHVPPYRSKLDLAPKLDDKLQIVHEGGQIVMESVGSVAVRNSIEKYQPLLGLHGHIHESRAFDRIGRTLCLNPGSEYAEGIFHGAIVNLDRDSVKGYMLITG
ncbi:metallophosphoesterase [Candidatus Bathyarchaeota archaeon]|nr:metallophosphoesterase [Candidatus Bathyarchaeota archaeon]